MEHSKSDLDRIDVKADGVVTSQSGFYQCSARTAEWIKNGSWSMSYFVVQCPLRNLGNELGRILVKIVASN